MAAQVSRLILTMKYSVSDSGRRGQSCIFFESVLAKKVRTDPDATPSLTHYGKTLALILALLPSLALASENKTPPAKDRINFYQAQLVCPAAPLIGCGS